MKCMVRNITAPVSTRSSFTIRDISFMLSEGQILAVIGESGSGKTSLLNALSGFLPVSHGAIILDDKTVSCASFCLSPHERNIGMIFQDENLLPHLSLFENLVLGMEKADVVSQNKNIHKLMKDLQLHHLKDSYPEHVSGGQQQRIALGRALLHNKKLLLFDEPFTGLDPHHMYTLARTIRDSIKKYKRAAVMVTHHTEEAFLIADLIAVMKNGVLLQTGKPEAVYHEPDTMEIAKYIGPVNSLPAKRSGNHFSTSFGPIELKYVVPHAIDEVSILTRPDDFMISDGTDFVVRDVRFMGMSHQVTVQKNDHVFQVNVSHHTQYHEGDTVNLKMGQDHPYVAYDMDGNKVV